MPAVDVGERRAAHMGVEHAPERFPLRLGISVRTGVDQAGDGFEDAQLLQIGEIGVDVGRRGHLLGALEHEDRAAEFGPVGGALEVPADRLEAAAEQRPLGDAAADRQPAFAPLQRSRTGQVEPLRTPARPYLNPALSPDGHRLAVHIEDETEDIWVRLAPG